ncbi:(2Fe-2S)-binding protein [uncultured Mycolicibacterium sp.]|uniref:(2Fe-2S)-binding protein n=1 Tax=uncultured Mycolicibacterium sp. TaxID=2320817 RepID=UPI002623641E|nr:(2Fe-2S)-binding protein [uncultured Mycolicibacterium sp.]
MPDPDLPALPAADGPGWQPFATLAADTDLVRDYVARTRAAMAANSGCAPAAVPPRAAASAWQFGLAGRLLSPAVAAATRFGRVPLLDADRVCRRDDGGHRPVLAVRDLAWADAPTPARAAALIADTVLAALAPLTATLRAVAGLSERIARGNLASAAHAAAPDGALAAALLETEPLCGTADLGPGGFRRRSCCLYYRVPGGGWCGDCVLAR